MDGHFDGNLQSVLAPHGPDAAVAATLAWVLFTGGTVVLCGVVVAVGFAIAGSPRAREILTRDATILVCGAGVPIVVLTSLLVYGLRSTAATVQDDPVLGVEVVGERWWWRIRYLDPHGVTVFETANELHIPVGGTVDLRLRSADVIHSFWVPSLAGKVDMIPGRVNRLRIRADSPGVFRGQCAEYCGGAHALMAFQVVADPPERFDAWREMQLADAVATDTEATRRGEQVFLANGCPLCHAVRGTPARGRFGPDLTHIGSRRRLAAGLLPNHVGTLAGWVASASHLKPGSRMPSFDTLPGAELRELAAYLAGLE